MAQKPGSICHVEIHSADPAKSQAFYGEVFGWRFNPIPEMNYTLWQAQSEPGGGLQAAGEGRPPQVLNYILSSNIDASLAKVAQNGGTVLQTKMEIPGQGWWALFQEPGGTMMALYEALRKAPAPPPRKPAKKATKKTAKKKAAGRKRRR